MNQTFTPLDLIRYLYHEMTADEAEAFRQWLSVNPEVQEQHRQFQQLINDLASCTLEPSETSLQIVIEAVRSKLPEPTA